MSASDQVENRWFSPYERIWHPASNVTPAMRPNWTILRMYFSLGLRSCGVIKLVKIMGKVPMDTSNDDPSPAGGQLRIRPAVSRNGANGRESGSPARQKAACR